MDDDMTFKRTGLSVGVVAGTQDTLFFGFEPYTIPVADCRYKISSVPNQKGKRVVEFVHTAKKRSYIPAPSLY